MTLSTWPINPRLGRDLIQALLIFSRQLVSEIFIFSDTKPDLAVYQANVSKSR